MQYHPNGALKQFTYGNGLVHSQSLNARQLPARLTDCTVAGTCASANRRLDLAYAYDGNGNVDTITDQASGGRQTRAMTYDALDRLTQATSSMFGTASYSYDVLDNLKTVKATGGNNVREHSYVYDASGRLSQVKQTVGGAVVANLTYDVRGNLAGWKSMPPGVYVSIFGTAGRIQIDDRYATIWLPDGTTRPIVSQGRIQGFQAGLVDLVHGLETGDPVQSPPREARKTVALIEAILASQAGGNARVPVDNGGSR